MPFTPSHIAAVLPLAGTPLFPAALAIGSMVPDLFYFVPLPIPRELTHAWFGVVTVDLAFGLALFALWDVALRRPIIDFLPQGARTRIASATSTGWRPAGMAWWVAALLATLSVLIGATTHVLWDSFTHNDAVVHQAPWLMQEWGAQPVYKWAQFASSGFGAVAVVVWTGVWLVRTSPVAPAASRLSTTTRGLAWITVVCAGGGISLWIVIASVTSGASPLAPDELFRIVSRGIAASAIVAALWSLAWWRMRPPATTRNAERP
jgi:hypothetical protein